MINSMIVYLSLSIKSIFIFLRKCSVIYFLSLLVFSVEAVEIKIPSYENRTTQMVSLSVYKQLKIVQEAVLEEKYKKASSQLHKILNSGKKLTSYERAKVFEMMSTVSMAMNQYKDAVQYSQNAIALEVLNRESEMQVFHRLVYMYFFLEDYGNAEDYVDLWFLLESKPSIKTYFLAAQIYAISNKMERALLYATQGMDVLVRTQAENHETLKGGKKPALRENWLKLLIAIRLNLKQYEQVSQDLERAISLWPQREEYYQQLSSVYLELKREKQSLAILSLAYQNEVVTTGPDISRLGQQFRYHGYPHKGAKILKQGLSVAVLKPTGDNWESIANAWIQAREWDKANSALIKAATLSNEGKIWLQLCQTSTQEEVWEKARHYCKKAIDKGKLNEEEGGAWYLVGLSEYYLEQFPKAIASFVVCSKRKTTKKTCGDWKDYVTQKILERENETLRISQNKADRLRRQHDQQEMVDKALLRKT